MKEIIIKTQKELDELPLSFEEYTIIQIKSDSDIRIYIKQAWGNSSVVAWENSSVVAWGNSSVVARENSSVEAWGNSSVVAWGNSSVVAWGNSSVVARENSSVEAWGNSSVVARGNSSVVAWENSSVVAWGNSSVVARGNSSVVAWGNSSVVAWENSSVEAWGNSSVEAWGNSSVVARGNSSVVAWGNSSVKICSEYVNIKKALQESVIIYIGIDKRIKPQIVKDNATVLYKNTATYTKDVFLDIYEENLIGKNHITLYKSVNPDTLCDFYTGKIKYKEVVKCPDWNPDESIQCGNGLHLSPTPQLALFYNNKGKVLKCVVAIKDFVVYSKDITKVRCKKVKVIEEK